VAIQRAAKATTRRVSTAADGRVIVGTVAVADRLGILSVKFVEIRTRKRVNLQRLIILPAAAVEIQTRRIKVT